MSQPLRAIKEASFSVAIIGGGVGGIAAGYELLRAGVNNFTIFEKSPGPGGTWRDNRYPGAACDVQSHLYSFSFAIKRDWTRAHATQPEILDYIEETVAQNGLTPHFRFNTQVRSIHWDDHDSVWILKTDDDDTLRFNVVIAGVGLLNVPNVPAFPGLSKFRGPKFHTARWEDVDLSGKRVAIVGTGSSAGQIVPAIADSVDLLYVYQREPGWVIPNKDGKGTLPAGVIAQFKTSPVRARLERWRVFMQREVAAAVITPGSYPHRRRTKICLDWLEECVANPEVRRHLTPSYPFNCKRPTRDAEFLRTFNKRNVKLVPYEVTAFTQEGVVSSDGVERKVDAVVLATGFKASSFLSTLEVVGRAGASLHKRWDEAGGPEAFLGMSTAGFPNFFMLYGPNTNSSTGSIIFNLECQARYIARCIRVMQKRSRRVIEVRAGIQNRYNNWLHRKMPRTAWLTGCHNYYRTPSGKQVTNWPHTAILYWFLLRVLSPRLPLYSFK